MGFSGDAYPSASLLLLLALAVITLGVLAGWQFLKFRKLDRSFYDVRRDNSRMRNEIGQLTGWSAQGRLHDDWPELLRTASASQSPDAAASGTAIPNDIFLAAAHEALANVQPPFFCTNDDDDDVRRVHERNVELLERLQEDDSDLLPALANGDMDRLFCYWRRLEAYFPESVEADCYGLAAHTLLSLLKKREIRVLVPRPMSMASANQSEFTTDDRENLREISRIRTMAMASVKRFANLQAGEELVVDCERPGWTGPMGQANPRILILDRSW